MTDDNKTSGFAGETDDDLLFDDLDFGDNDEDLLTALQPKKNKSEHTLDVTEFFIGLEDDAESDEEGEAPEGTIVLSSLEAAALDSSGDEPETTVLGSADDTPETTVLGSADEEPETTVLASEETPSEPTSTGDAVESTNASGAIDVSGAIAAIGTSGTSEATAEQPAEAESAPIDTGAPPAEGSGPKPLVIALIAAAIIAIAGIVIFVVGSSSSEPATTSNNDGQSQQIESTSESESQSVAEADEKTYTITIEYRDMQTGKPVQKTEEQEVTEEEFPKSITAEPVKGYEIVKGIDNNKTFYTVEDHDRKKDAKLDLKSEKPSDHLIVFTCAMQVGYTVRYLENGTDAELSPSNTIEGKLSGDIVTEHSIDIDGYNLTSDAEVTITLNNDEVLNVITFHYDKKPEEPAPAPAQTAPTYNYTPPAYTPPAVTTPAPAPSAPADDAVDGSW